MYIASSVSSAGQLLLEVGGCVHVVRGELEALCLHLRDHQRLGVLTAGVAGVDGPLDAGPLTTLGPDAVAALRPPVVGEQLGCGVRVEEVLVQALIAPLADRGHPHHADVLLGVGVDRLVDGVDDLLRVDRLHERLAQDRVGERTRLLLDPEVLVLGAKTERELDVRVVQTLVDAGGRLREDRVDLTGQQRVDLGVAVLSGTKTTLSTSGVWVLSQ